MCVHAEVKPKIFEFLDYVFQASSSEVLSCEEVCWFVLHQLTYIAYRSVTMLIFGKSIARMTHEIEFDDLFVELFEEGVFGAFLCGHWTLLQHLGKTEWVFILLLGHTFFEVDRDCCYAYHYQLLQCFSFHTTTSF